jgi:hypothetical protein
MNYIKSNWKCLAIGAAVGYFLAKNGGVGGAVNKVKSTAKNAV